jgi:hypothetical protein
MNLLSSYVIYIKIAVAIASMLASYYIGTEHGYSSRQSEVDSIKLELAASKEEYGKLVQEYQAATLRLQVASRALADSALANTEKEVVVVEKAITKYKDRVVIEGKSCTLSKSAVDFINSLGE